VVTLKKKKDKFHFSTSVFIQKIKTFTVAISGTPTRLWCFVRESNSVFKFIGENNDIDNMLTDKNKLVTVEVPGATEKIKEGYGDIRKKLDKINKDLDQRHDEINEDIKRKTDELDNLRMQVLDRNKNIMGSSSALGCLIGGIFESMIVAVFGKFLFPLFGVPFVGVVSGVATGEP